MSQIQAKSLATLGIFIDRLIEDYKKQKNDTSYFEGQLLKLMDLMGMTDISNAKQKIPELFTNISNLKSSFTLLSKQGEVQGQENQNKTLQLQTVTQSNSELTTQLAALKAQNETMSIEIDSLKTKNTSLNQSKKRLEEKKAAEKLKLTQLNEVCDLNLKNKELEVKELALNLEDTKAQCEIAIVEWRENAQTLKDQVASLESTNKYNGFQLEVAQTNDTTLNEKCMSKIKAKDTEIQQCQLQLQNANLEKLKLQDQVVDQVYQDIFGPKILALLLLESWSDERNVDIKKLVSFNKNETLYILTHELIKEIFEQRLKKIQELFYMQNETSQILLKTDLVSLDGIRTQLNETLSNISQLFYKEQNTNLSEIMLYVSEKVPEINYEDVKLTLERLWNDSGETNTELLAILSNVLESINLLNKFISGFNLAQFKQKMNFYTMSYIVANINARFYDNNSENLDALTQHYNQYASGGLNNEKYSKILDYIQNTPTYQLIANYK